MGDEQEQLLTVPEAAASLGVTQPAVRLAIYNGRLNAVTKYGRRLVSHTDLEEYRQRTQPDGVKKHGRPRKVAR